MIFVTVGHQMPFDRLIRAVDEWAMANSRDDVFAQVGTTDYEPEYIEWKNMLTPDEFEERMSQADFVIAHAGTGTILAALEHGTPIVVMPRRAALLETRNDHQVATAQRFKEMGQVLVALDEHEMPAILDHSESMEAGAMIDSSASPELIAALKGFVDQTE